MCRNQIIGSQKRKATKLNFSLCAFIFVSKVFAFKAKISLGVFNFFQTFIANFGQPSFERLGFG